MTNWWSNPSVWIYLTLGIGIFMLILAPVQANPDEKRLFYGISRISLSVMVVLAGLFKFDGDTKAVVIILGLIAVWFLGSFLRYLGHQADEPEAPRAQPHA